HAKPSWNRGEGNDQVARCGGRAARGAGARRVRRGGTPRIPRTSRPRDASPRGSLSGFGNPLLMAPDDLAVFSTGQETFIELESLPQLGPLFNSRSCATCHFQPALGGSGSFINEIRIRNNTRPGPLQIFASDNI